jgi:secreted protein with Ig-like and vWFA domain
MKPESEDIQSLLLDALLQEQSRTNREASLQATEDAIAASAVQGNTTRTRRSRAPWLVGIAATAVLSAGVMHQQGMFRRNEPIIAYHDAKEQVLVESRSLPEKSGDQAEAPVEDIIEVKTIHPPAPPAAPTSSQLTTTNQGASRYDYANPTQEQLSVDAAPPPATAAPLPSRENRDTMERGETPRLRTISPPHAFAQSSIGRDKIIPQEAPPSGDRYGALIDPTWKNPRENALSTFSVDVDNAAYSNIRRMIEEGRNIPTDAVRIEECINAFDYSYAPPSNEDAFAVHQALRPCPWNEKHALLRIGIKGRDIPANERPASNLVFLIDLSGSMQSPDKLPLVKESLKLLLSKLDERDSVSYVVYAGSEGVVLPATAMDENGRTRALKALDELSAGGSTNGGAGIQRAYQIAQEQFRKGGVNRVILCSDGDFNVGVTGTSQLVSLVKERAASNIYLSVLSFGTGNLNDEMLESISRDGNGNYYYIDGIREARKVFLQKLSGTLVTIAKDVKLQLEFNPARVASYRLIGYANRQLRDEDFKNDKVDAGDIGAGHEVTAFYEIVPAGESTATESTELKYQPGTPQPAAAPNNDALADEWLTVKLRHKHPEGDVSKLQEHVLRGEIGNFTDADTDFRFAAAVAMFGMKLRGDGHVGAHWEEIRKLATQGLGDDAKGERAAFIDLLRRLPGQ